MVCTQKKVNQKCIMILNECCRLKGPWIGGAGTCSERGAPRGFVGLDISPLSLLTPVRLTP